MPRSLGSPDAVGACSARRQGARPDRFHLRHDTLDIWLRRRALGNQASGASRTSVVAQERRVVGYYCLSSGALDSAFAPGAIRRNMPDPIPMVILGRSAVDRLWQGRGLGAALLQDAFLRSAAAASILGIRGVLVHAISQDTKTFYERYGFTASPAHPMTLILSPKSALRQEADAVEAANSEAGSLYSVYADK